MTMRKLGVALSISASLIAGTLVGSAVQASDLSFGATVRSWMNPEVGDAWSQGYYGQGVTITSVDDFSSSSRYSGNFGTGSQRLRHGEWVELEASMIAPGATMLRHDFYNNHGAVKLHNGLNVANLSYSMRMQSGINPSWIGWSNREASLINYARNGDAVIVKAAGNYKIAVDGIDSSGNQDYLNLALIGHQSAIFVGALSRNGTVDNPASLASYSNRAGSNETVQNQFLVVGVESGKTGLAGTSFAAPIVSGYAAVLGSKFTSATPTQITNQLLTTARTDTIHNFNASVHGRGEASIARALAPISIGGVGGSTSTGTTSTGSTSDTSTSTNTNNGKAKGRLR